MWVFRFDLCGHQHVQSLLVSLALLLHCLGSTLGGCALSEPRQPWSGARDSGCGAGEAAREVTLLPGHCVLQPTRDHRVNKLSVGSLGGRGCARVCVCVCVCECQVKVVVVLSPGAFLENVLHVSAGDECLCYMLGWNIHYGIWSSGLCVPEVWALFKHISSISFLSIATDKH